MGNRAYIYELTETISEIRDLTERAKSLLVKSVDELFTYLPVNAVLPLKKPCDVQTWNKGYDFTVTGFKKRGDGCIMMCGTYCGKEAEEFLSYIHTKSIEELYEEVVKSFYKRY